MAGHVLIISLSLHWCESATYYSLVDRLAGKDASQYAGQDDDVASKRSVDDHQFMERAASGLTVVMERQADNG
jgi:hypothetical protein